MCLILVSSYFQQLLYQLFTLISNDGPPFRTWHKYKEREQSIKVLDHLKDDYHSLITKPRKNSLSLSRLPCPHTYFVYWSSSKFQFNDYAFLVGKSRSMKKIMKKPKNIEAMELLITTGSNQGYSYQGHKVKLLQIVVWPFNDDFRESYYWQLVGY
jgi:hypothetical protein